MNSKNLIKTLLNEKLKNAENLFNEQNFKILLEWSRDCAKEYFATQPRKRFLIPYVDDIAIIVDKYLLKRRSKMYNDALKKRNKLFSCLQSIDKTIDWIIERWINTFINLTTNPNYRDYIDISKSIKEIFEQNFLFHQKQVSITGEEYIKKIPENELKNGLKKVWEQSLLDTDFDLTDFSLLTNKYGFKVNDILGYTPNDNIECNVVQVGSGNLQLEINFAQIKEQ